MNVPDERQAEESVRRAIDVLDEPRGSIRDAVLRRIGGRSPQELTQLRSLVWMRRASGIAAALFLALFAADFFDAEDTPAPGTQPADTTVPAPAWVALEQSEVGMYSQEGWIVSELLAGEGSE